MDKTVKIRDFLDQLKRQHDASGTESQVYFVKGKDGKEYALKSYILKGNQTIRFGPEWKFFNKMEILKKETDELIKKGVNIARIYDFGIIEDVNGEKAVLKLEDKLPGSPIYILRGASMDKSKIDYLGNAENLSPKRLAELRLELGRQMQKHNIGQQRKMLDASDDTFSKLVQDFHQVYSKPGSLTFDGFAENFLFYAGPRDKGEKFSIIDVSAERAENAILSSERVVSDMIHVIVLSKSSIFNMGPDAFMLAELFKNNTYIQSRVIKVLGRAGLLVASSDIAKERLLTAVEQNIDDIGRFANRIKVRKK